MSNLVLEFKALSDKKGLIVFQDVMLSDTFLLFRLLNYSHITFGNRFTAKFLAGGGSPNIVNERMSEILSD